jgi:hypothetical protein
MGSSGEIPANIPHKKSHKSAFAPQQHQKLHLHHSSTKKAHKSAFAPQQHQKISISIAVNKTAQVLHF